MRKLLNTLYVTTPESYLSKDGLNVVVSVKQQEIFRIPASNIEGIVCFGYLGASPGLMGLCADKGIALTFLSPSGRFISRVQGPTKGNVLLRTAQYRLAADTDVAFHLGRLFIAGKIQNSRNILRRFIRDHGDDDKVSRAADDLHWRLKTLWRTTDIDMVRGVEGEAAGLYFGALPRLILHQQKDFPFAGRNRRPPKDAVNAMLSFVYTLLAHDVAAALETVGLDPYVGFLHKLRPGRTSLALDVMEEMRAYLADRLVLSLINRRQISATDFIHQGSEGISMTDGGRRTILSAWQARKRETIVHPYLNEQIPLGLLPYVQAMLLAKFLRSDLDDYPVFLIR